MTQICLVDIFSLHMLDTEFKSSCSRLNSKFWNTSNNSTFNSTMITSPEDLEGSSITPVIVPGVSNQPVRSSSLHTPAQESDSMPTKRLARHMLINPRLVVGEVFIHSESRLSWTIGHQLHLDLLDVPLN